MQARSGGKVFAGRQALQDLPAREGILLMPQPGFCGAGGGAWPLHVFQRVHGNDIPGFQA